MRPSDWLSAKLTPFALVVDDQSVDSGTVTIRDRDTLQQKRIPQSYIPGKI